MSRLSSGLSKETTSHMTAAEVVFHRAFLGRRRLHKGHRATERPGKRGVLETQNADVVNAACAAGASGAFGHLDLDGEVGGLSSGEAANANAGHVLGDLCVLEGRGVFAS